MPIDLEIVGRPADPVELGWTSTDAIVYALGVGAGADDPTRELAFTTENTGGTPQRMLPGFAATLAMSAGDTIRLGDYDRAALVHAEQAIDIHRPLPAAGRARLTPTVTGIHDKGSGALVVTETEAVEPSSGERLFTSRSASFIRGEGGFGGDRGPSSSWDRPLRPPDHSVRCPVRPEQALLYRLSGDRNPLHTDPAFAAGGGFARPILHGLCTYGYTARVLLHVLCGGDPARFGSMSGRFTAPVWPGDTLTVSIWADAGRAWYQTSRTDGTVVLDRGTATFGEPR